MKDWMRRLFLNVGLIGVIGVIVMANFTEANYDFRAIGWLFFIMLLIGLVGNVFETIKRIK